jgi:hypothetical protein
LAGNPHLFYLLESYLRVVCRKVDRRFFFCIKFLKTLDAVSSPRFRCSSDMHAVLEAGSKLSLTLSLPHKHVCNKRMDNGKRFKAYKVVLLYVVST